MSEDILIRPVTARDAAALLEIYAPYVETTAVSFEYETPCLEEFRRRILRISERYPYLAAQRSGRLLGYAYAAPFKERPAYDWSVETTVYVRRDMKRQGIGRLLYDSLETALRAQGVLNMNACVACPPEADEYLTEDSLRFHQRLGFEPVGRFHTCGYKFGRWYDMVWLEKSLGAHTASPAPVRPFREI